MDNNLPELRDIHLPEGVAIWPPAYGWWVILAVFVAGFITYHAILYIRRKSKKLYALRLIGSLDGQNNIAAAREMSEILRRICVYKYKEAASLYGVQWTEFLNSHSRIPLSERAAELLNNAPYIADESSTYNQVDLEDLSSFCRRWIGENL